MPLHMSMLFFVRVENKGCVVDRCRLINAIAWCAVVFPTGTDGCTVKPVDSLPTRCDEGGMRVLRMRIEAIDPKDRVGNSIPNAVRSKV